MNSLIEIGNTNEVVISIGLRLLQAYYYACQTVDT